MPILEFSPNGMLTLRDSLSTDQYQGTGRDSENGEYHADAGD
jgi:hypothetical protein